MAVAARVFYLPPTPTRPLRTAVVDDHPVFLDGLVEALAKQPDFRVVGQEGDGGAAVKLVAQEAPDVLLLDLSMGGVGGLEALRQIRSTGGATRVLVFTSSDDGDDAVAALDAGAAGYLTKAARYEELVGAIREVHAGGRPIGEAVARRLAARDRSKPFTPREYEVLRLISLGLTYVQIGERLAITERTARAHLGAVKEKLWATSNAQAVTRGFERGLLREDD
jgi:DNA-binding NarL/FixJ family response regulator